MTFNKKKPLISKLNKSSAMISVGLNLMFYFILISAILFVSLSGVYGTDDGGRPRRVGGYSVMRVASGSMYPELQIDTLIVTRYVDTEELEVGEVVTFLNSNEQKTVTHRIYEIYENHNNMGTLGFRLIGDADINGEANYIPDREVHEADEFIGRVVMSSYSLGRFLMFVHHNFLDILTVALVILTILLVLKVIITPKTDKEETTTNHKGVELQRAEI